ncbi:PTS sugar transporter subunit IIB [Gilliamella sp. W8145]|uniref:PTS sugar transporter subunit IIB n=1 Tax=Gilliamella sp. W8145 TaxID=2750990 RepID=UPI000B1BD61C|nr:PTS sugar transporter subunit IIB [Gilliamella sp. W8145]MBI0103442.1 PTS sugar transporter subunit IIB [Gilliamella sp. W8145]
MKQVIFACAGGMSTSLLVNKIRKEALERSLDFDFIAISEQLLYQHLNSDSDKIIAVLLGPQMRFALDESRKQTEKYGIPIDIIDPVAYGTMNAGKVLDQILQMIEV